MYEWMHCEVSVLYFFLSLAFQLLDVDPSLYVVHVSVSRVISRPRAPTVSCGATASTSCPFWGSKRRIEGLDRPTRTNCLCTARGQFSRSVQTVPAAASCHQRASQPQAHTADPGRCPRVDTRVEGAEWHHRQTEKEPKKKLAMAILFWLT